LDEASAADDQNGRIARKTDMQFLQIREVGGKPRVVAKPSGQAETSAFGRRSVLTRHRRKPAHDFPQHHSSVCPTSVTARIEGTLNGQARGVVFHAKSV
jgi:hypothetical protein